MSTDDLETIEMGYITLRQYTADAFTDRVFCGNPAAVCLTERDLPEDLMRKIAKENNLSETAFVNTKKEPGGAYPLRWFTPGGEIDLCGHATLASAFVMMTFVDNETDTVSFNTKSGILTVKKEDGVYSMDMPAYELRRSDVTDAMEKAIGKRPSGAWIGRDLICVMDDEKDVFAAAPDADLVNKLDGLLLHVTARGTGYDCVTRSFAPKMGIREDPVCGSGHCHVVPLWAEKLNKNALTAYQASERGGVLYCRLEGRRAILAGKAALWAVSEIRIPDDMI